MRNEIGSDYWLTEKDYRKALSYESTVNLPYNFQNVALTGLCRTGIELFLDNLDKHSGIALVPEFTCHSVIEPFVHHGYDVLCYKLNLDFSIDNTPFRTLVSATNPDVIILHSYFGFDTLSKDIKDIASNAIVIEDLTQRFLSSFPLIDADCYVGSIRKWMPIPDGGFYGGNITIQEPDKENELFLKLELNALLAKGKYMNGEGVEKNAFREAFATARQMLEKQHHFHTMSKLSRQIYNSIDLERWKSIRRENGRFLIEHLQEFDFLELPLNRIDDETVPFMIPVIVKEGRKEFQTYLARNDIYATVIWTLPDELIGKVSDIGQYIYEHILCFHCDQRYGIDDMQRIYNVIKQYKEN